jgi:hypothetical protein
MSSADDAVEARLRRLATQHDDAPDLVVQSAKAAWEVRDLDAELAALVADSWTDAEAVATRSPLGDVRMLAFERGAVVVEVDVERDAVLRTARLHGLVTGALALTLVGAQGRRPVPIDDGHFDVADVPWGPVRLELTTPDDRRVTTAWFSV